MSPLKQQYQIDKLRQQDLQQEAAQYRLGQIAKKKTSTRRIPRLATIYKPTLYRLGQQLESLGNTLQIRYGEMQPSPID